MISYSPQYMAMLQVIASAPVGEPGCPNHIRYAPRGRPQRVTIRIPNTGREAVTSAGQPLMQRVRGRRGKWFRSVEYRGTDNYIFRAVKYRLERRSKGRFTGTFGSPAKPHLLKGVTR